MHRYNDSPVTSTQIHNLGPVLYGTGAYIQKVIARQVQLGRMANQILLLEHNPVFSLGRNASDNDIHVDSNVLNNLGIEIHTTDRGGQVTYHGPGQIIVYPIYNLKNKQKNIKLFVRDLEEVMLRTAEDFTIKATRLEGLPGIWVTTNNGLEKLGAIGLHLHKWVTTHGIAFNVAPNLDNFKLITPCGINDKGVCSLKSLLGVSAPTWDEVVERMQWHLSSLFGLSSKKIDYPKKQIALVPWRLTKFGLQYLANSQSLLPAIVCDEPHYIQSHYQQALELLQETTGLMGNLTPNHLDFTHTYLHQLKMVDSDQFEPIFTKMTYLPIEIDVNARLCLTNNSSSGLYWHSFEKAKQELSSVEAKAALTFLNQNIQKVVTKEFFN